MSDYFYLNEKGDQVFTSQYLLNRKSCCKTACLHCPYGFTVKKHGFTFELVETDDDIKLALHIVAGDFEKWQKYPPEHRYFVVLKDQYCAVFGKNHIQIKDLWLKPEFKSQGISKELLESYFF
jgi:hypothetical protein